MKQFLLAAVLIAVPVGAFAAFQHYRDVPAVQATASLGDLSSFRTIATDAGRLAATGDMAATAVRMTEFETAWDDAQSRLRALNTDLWGDIDDAHDAALHAVRTKSPKAAEVTAAITALVAVLDNPTPATGGGSGPETVGTVTITDAGGRALPCEEMLKTYRAEMATATLSDADRTTVDELLAKGTERCNADDDRRADTFFAQGLTLIRR